MRIDRWLWAARFYKTRALASDAVRGGRVHVAGQAVKASREVRPGDTLEITLGQVRRTVVVRALSERRGPAKEAVLLYEETPESLSAREAFGAERRLMARARPVPGGRPTKRERRRSSW